MASPPRDTIVNTAKRSPWRAGLLAGLVLAVIDAAAADIRWQAPLDIAQGKGERGAWRQTETHYDFVDDATVAWSPRGELAVAWADQKRRAVLVQRYSATGEALRPTPVLLSGEARTFSWMPRLAWAPEADGQQLHVLWQEIIFSGGSHGGEMLTATSNNGGRSFAATRNLSQSKEGDGKGRISRAVWDNGSFDIATAPGGTVLAAWTEFDGRLWSARSANGGSSFADPVLVAGEPPESPARAPALAVGKDGAVALAWSVGEDKAGDIHIAVSSDGGKSFGPPRVVAVTPGFSDAPKLAFDTKGGLHLVYAESRGGPFTDSAILHRRSSDGGHTFGPAREISKPLPPGYRGAGFPAIGIDGRDRVVVAWELLRGAAPPHRSYGLAIAVSDDGRTFGAPSEIPASADPQGGFNGSSQGLLMNKLAVRADGEIAVVNSALKIGSHSRVWLLRGVLH
ncbi:exo-alpha-sialidase [Ramlibacter sp. G-1-2-2]|uniref:Exo-alpha-sialidase n=1 Tax=Ramlibacter agri TaxID=2728837 RepID=A0A848H2D0_9BURK|nr:sialidase family protein [Ramlibacter agri]NML43290.1 exo-alpha-sialidase [Ramlibacter agri]